MATADKTIAGFVDQLAGLAADGSWLESLVDGSVVDQLAWVLPDQGNDFSAAGERGVASAFARAKKLDLTALVFTAGRAELQVNSRGHWTSAGAPLELRLQRLDNFAGTGRTELTMRYRMPSPAAPDPVWASHVRDLFANCSVVTGAQLGDIRPMVADENQKAMTPLERFRWVYPLAPEAVVPQVQYYGWLVWLHPVSVDRLGGADRMEAEAPVHLVERHEVADGTAVVAQLSDHPRSLTVDQMNDWRSYLSPAMNARPDFEAGRNPEAPPAWVHPDDW